MPQMRYWQRLSQRSQDSQASDVVQVIHLCVNRRLNICGVILCSRDAYQSSRSLCGPAVDGVTHFPDRLETCAHVRNLSGEVLRRSEEHTSELQSRQYLVCRLLLGKTT